MTDTRTKERATTIGDGYLQAILDAAIDGIVTIDQQGRIISVNQAASTMFDYDSQELIGRNISELMPSPFCEEHDQYIARFLATREAHVIGIGREAVGRRRDGSVFPIDLAVSEVPGLGMFTGIVRDITERKRAEEALRREHELTERLQREILEIAADEQRRMGQELHDGTQQQLTGLRLLAKQLSDAMQRLTEEAISRNLDGEFSQRLLPLRDCADRIHRGLDEAAQDVHQLARGLIPVELDARGLMSALNDLAHRIHELGQATCTFECDRLIEVDDNFAATHLYRIAQEAVHNAQKHSQANRIELSLAESDGRVLLQVRDNGRGIDMRSPDRGGMGLRIMAYRAELIHADLEIAPIPAGGTLVRCLIPRQTTNEDHTPTRKRQTRRKRSGRTNGT